MDIYGIPMTSPRCCPLATISDIQQSSSPPFADVAGGLTGHHLHIGRLRHLAGHAGPSAPRR